MIWVVAVCVAAALFAAGWTINAVLFVPYRVRPLYRLLYRRSAWYRRWVFERIVVPSVRRMGGAFAGMVPAARRASEAFAGLHEGLAGLARRSLS